MKLWPHEVAMIHLSGEEIFVHPHELLDGIRRVVDMWVDPEFTPKAHELLDRLCVDFLVGSAQYDAETQRLADAAVHATLGFVRPEHRRFCVDTLQELVP